MAVLESSIVTFSQRRTDDGDQTVVWLRGEHDISTVGSLSELLTRVIALDDADLVVDLSEVQFMGVVTVELLLHARERLELMSRSLTLRSPSRRAAHVLGLCDRRPRLTTSLTPTHDTGPKLAH